MGTWGPGNFDNDDAVDYLSEVIRGFVDTVEHLFTQGRASLDDQGEGRLMPTVEMIGVLCDWCQGGPPAIRVVAPPRPRVIRRWKQQYLEIYDEQIDGLLLPGKEAFGPERRVPYRADLRSARAVGDGGLGGRPSDAELVLQPQL